MNQLQSESVESYIRHKAITAPLWTSVCDWVMYRRFIKRVDSVQEHHTCEILIPHIPFNHPVLLSSISPPLISALFPPSFTLNFFSFSLFLPFSPPPPTKEKRFAAAIRR